MELSFPGQVDDLSAFLDSYQDLLGAVTAFELHQGGSDDELAALIRLAPMAEQQEKDEKKASHKDQFIRLEGPDATSAEVGL